MPRQHLTESQDALEDAKDHAADNASLKAALDAAIEAAKADVKTATGASLRAKSLKDAVAEVEGEDGDKRSADDIGKAVAMDVGMARSCPSTRWMANAALRAPHGETAPTDATVTQNETVESRWTTTQARPGPRSSATGNVAPKDMRIADRSHATSRAVKAASYCRHNATEVRCHYRPDPHVGRKQYRQLCRRYAVRRNPTTRASLA